MAYATQKKLALVPVQGRQRDGGAPRQLPPLKPPRPTRALPHLQGGDTQAPPPSAPPPPQRPAGPRPPGAGRPPREGRTIQSQAGGRGDRATPPRRTK